MKKLYILFLILLPIIINAQDTLYKRDSSVHIVKILEINDNQVKYKKSENPDGPVYVISKEYISKIAYKSGQVDVITGITSNITQPIKPDPRTIDFGRHFISINPMDLLFGCLTLGYEYTFSSGNFSVKIPLSLGLISLGLADSISDEAEFGYYNRFKVFNTGLGFYTYLSGQGTARYFMGLSFEFGRYKYWNYYYYYPYIYPYPNNYYSQKEYYTLYAIMFQNGFLLQPTKHFNISLNLGMGFYWENADVPEEVLFFTGGLNIGFKF